MEKGCKNHRKSLYSPKGKIVYAESKEKRGENSDFWFLGRTVRADIFGRIYLGSKKFSQMAAFVGKSKNIESSLNLNNYCQISIQLACLT